MGINILSTKAVRDFNSSLQVTANHVDKIKEQGQDAPKDNSDCIALIKADNEKQRQELLGEVKRKLSIQTKRCVEMAAERGASHWMIALPLKKQGFVLNRSEFMDSLNLRYHRELRGLPTVCPCSQKFDITHALNCKRGGFVYMRHDNIKDFLLHFSKRPRRMCRGSHLYNPLKQRQYQQGSGTLQTKLDWTLEQGGSGVKARMPTSMCESQIPYLHQQ